MVRQLSSACKTLKGKKMDTSASNVKRVNVSHDQYYEWGTVENKFAKNKKYACIDYYFHGEIWGGVIALMKRANMKSIAILYYKGAVIDEENKLIKVRGHFVRDVISDKHLAFWSHFFKCSQDNPPKFAMLGAAIKLPSIAGDNDSLNIFVNGQNIQEVLCDPEEGAA
jgi:hypothetical protein